MIPFPVLYSTLQPLARLLPEPGAARQHACNMQPDANKVWNPISMTYWTLKNENAPRHRDKRRALQQYYESTEKVANTEVFMFPGILPHLRCSGVVDKPGGGTQALQRAGSLESRAVTRREWSPTTESKSTVERPLRDTARARQWLTDHRFPARSPDKFKWSTPGSLHASLHKETFCDPKQRRDPYADYGRQG